MGAAAWTFVGAAITILIATGASFRGLRDEVRAQGKRIDALGNQMGVPRERMAHLGGLLEVLREAIAAKRVAQAHRGQRTRRPSCTQTSPPTVTVVSVKKFQRT